MNVVTAESCECMAEGGRLLGGVDPAWLETVIPKQPPMVVMVVRGQHKGQVSNLGGLPGIHLHIYLVTWLVYLCICLLTDTCIQVL